LGAAEHHPQGEQAFGMRKHRHMHFQHAKLNLSSQANAIYSRKMMIYYTFQQGQVHHKDKLFLLPPYALAGFDLTVHSSSVSVGDGTTKINLER
jgi:hypothetical protein